MTPLEHLRFLQIEDSRLKYPLTPQHHRMSMLKPYSDKNEKGLVRCITDFLKFTGNQGERISNKGTRVDERVVVENSIGIMKTIGSVRYNYSQQERGTADISATIKKQFGNQVIGCSVKIEIKLPGDRMRPAQIEYKAKIERAGGFYWVVKSFDDFHRQYHEFIEGI